MTDYNTVALIVSSSLGSLSEWEDAARSDIVRLYSVCYVLRYRGELCLFILVNDCYVPIMIRTLECMGVRALDYDLQSEGSTFKRSQSTWQTERVL